MTRLNFKISLAAANSRDFVLLHARRVRAPMVRSCLEPLAALFIPSRMIAVRRLSPDAVQNWATATDLVTHRAEARAAE